MKSLYLVTYIEVILVVYVYFYLFFQIGYREQERQHMVSLKKFQSHSCCDKWMSL